MLLEHFTYGIEDGTGYKFRKSKAVTQLLPDDKIKWLMHVGDNVKGTNILLKIWEKEQIATYTYVKPMKDGYGRKGFWSHTIILKLSELTPTLLRFLEEPHIEKDELEPITYE